MILIMIVGGLGNQLFQLFSGISYALTRKMPFRITRQKLDESAARPTYWDTLFKSMAGYSMTNQELNKFIIEKHSRVNRINEPAFNYIEIPNPPLDFKPTDVIYLTGYFQSWRYFYKNYDDVAKIMRLNSSKIAVRDKSKVDLDVDICVEKVSMHFRLGDYKKLSDVGYFITMPYKYYEDALMRVVGGLRKDTHTVRVFCFFEDEDKDIVNERVNNLRSVYDERVICNGEGNRVRFEFMLINNAKYVDWEQMIMMSLCDHNIIANSSFSWWGAYFNDAYQAHLKNPELPKPVITYPAKWFGKLYEDKNTVDLCPEDWEKVAVE